MAGVTISVPSCQPRKLYPVRVGSAGLVIVTPYSTVPLVYVPVNALPPFTFQVSVWELIVQPAWRVLFVVASAPTLEAAHVKAMAEVAKIECDNLFYRKDIGHRAFKK